VALFALSCLAAATSAGAADATALLRQMHEALVPNEPMHAAFTLEIDNEEGHPTRWTGTLERTGGAAPSVRMHFDSPADLRGIELTVQRDPKGLDVMRVFLPSVRRTRTIREDMRGESFLGSDFNYEDLGFEQLGSVRSTVLGADVVNGRACDRVESVPARPWWYGRIVRCIDREDHLPRLTEYFDAAGAPYKRRMMDAIETIGGHPTPLRLRIEVIPDRTSSMLTLSDVRYGS
jgi:hypothetical protein